MKGLDWRLAGLALLLGLALGGRGAWLWQANSYGKTLAEQAGAYQVEREHAATAMQDWQEAEKDRRLALEGRLQASDETHYKELHDALQAQARLRDRLATADLRLSILLRASGAESGGGGLPAATSSGRMVHGGQRAELDPAAAQRIVTIADDGDQGLIALKACQAYVHALGNQR